MAALSAPVVGEDHVQGSRSATYTLVEYGDLQCPDTALAEPELAEVMERMEGKLRLVFRHFPLIDIHPFAYRAAEAAEAAGAQGKFWEMRQQLLEHQDHLDRESLVQHAQNLGLDVARFERDLDSHAFAERIDIDIQSGARSGVDYTPCYFLNGAMLDPGLDLFEVFDALEEPGEEDEAEDDIY